MKYTLKKIQADLKHLHNTTKDQRTKDFLKGMLMEISLEVQTNPRKFLIDTATEYGTVFVDNNNSKESRIL